ncbi:hypothetical protein N7510_004643 [Penicillium lagena]|uniref:uncharacterized protein n=1 Tax=Penicillium lagena TaxID=94218 RepID=UPI002541427C|nr:uncharacterized protein N7510_004643 [Penicillium lagena]KAJ5620659.1 hypothetical protein N7510_004643 [Penicillium lagena]
MYACDWMLGMAEIQFRSFCISSFLARLGHPWSNHHGIEQADAYWGPALRNPGPGRVSKPNPLTVYDKGKVTNGTSQLSM